MGVHVIMMGGGIRLTQGKLRRSKESKDAVEFWREFGIIKGEVLTSF